MDKDVVNLIHYLRWNVSVHWSDVANLLFCNTDTPTDAAPYLADDGRSLPEALRRFVLAVDEQPKAFPKRTSCLAFRSQSRFGNRTSSVPLS